MREVIGLAQETKILAPGLIAIPFQAHHLENMQVARHQAGLVALMSGDLLHATGAMLAHGPSYTLLGDGNIICCTGVFPWSQWRGQAWGYAAPGFSRWRAAVIPHAIAFLDERQNSGMHRIEAVISLVPLYPRRYAEMLGFEKPRL